MLKKSGIADTIIWGFCKLTPIWFKAGFIDVNISHSRRNLDLNNGKYRLFNVLCWL